MTRAAAAGGIRVMTGHPGDIKDAIPSVFRAARIMVVITTIVWLL
jgi:hypothetical protein